MFPDQFGTFGVCEEGVIEENSHPEFCGLMMSGKLEGVYSCWLSEDHDCGLGRSGKIRLACVDRDDQVLMGDDDF